MMGIMGIKADSMAGYKPTVWETGPKFLFLRNENPDPGTNGQPSTASGSRSKNTLLNGLKLK